MSLNLNEGFDDCNQLKNSTSTTGKAGIKSKKNLLFENRSEDEWLSTEEAAHYLSITENALRIMSFRGQVQTYKFGRRLRFRLKDCQALIINTRGA